MSGCKQVIAYSQPLEQFDETRVIMRIDLIRSLSGLVSFDCDCRTVGIRTRNHQHSITPQAMVTGDNIARQVRAGDVTDMDIRICVRPGNSD